jgi:succinate-acetate transporter protein
MPYRSSRLTFCSLYPILWSATVDNRPLLDYRPLNTAVPVILGMWILYFWSMFVAAVQSIWHHLSAFLILV